MAQPPVSELQAKFRYDAETGHLYLRESKKAGFDISQPVGQITLGYLRVMMDRKHLTAHRVAWALHYGEWPYGQLDHINRDRADNRIVNLRLATPSQNTANSIRPSAAGARGVRWCKGKPQAQIKHGGKLRHLGTFDTVDEAAHAYNRAAIELHGEFAVLNPIGEDKHASNSTEE